METVAAVPAGAVSPLPTMKKIEILGAGCGRCRMLEETVRQAVARMELDCEVVKSTDPMKFIDYNITAIPALVMDGRLLTVGRVPSLAEMESLLGGKEV